MGFFQIVIMDDQKRLDGLLCLVFASADRDGACDN